SADLRLVRRADTEVGLSRLTRVLRTPPALRSEFTAGRLASLRAPVPLCTVAVPIRLAAPLRLASVTRCAVGLIFSLADFSSERLRRASRFFSFAFFESAFLESDFLESARFALRASFAFSL